MSGRLIGVRARRPVLAVIGVGVVVVVVLAAVVWHGSTTRFDSWAFTQVYLHLGPIDSERRRAWLLFSEPELAFAVPAVVAVGSLLVRRWDVLALAVAGPALALGVTEVIGKPLVARTYGAPVPGVVPAIVTGAYPSGHETGLVSWLVLVVIVVFQLSRSTRSRAAALAVAVVWAVGGAVGLTANFYHYATDTIGAVGVAVAVMLGVALAVDAVAARQRPALSSPDGRARSRTVREA